MRKFSILLLLLLIFGCDNIPEKVIYPNEFIAKVIGIRDGDTIEVLYNNRPLVIRFEHIDCPEKKQPFGKKAKQFVSDYAFGENVKIISKGKTDRWKRLIAVIELESGENLNKLLVSKGLAMHYKKYSKDKSYDKLEQIAKEKKIGIWSQKDVIEPWNYRKSKKKKKKNVL